MATVRRILPRRAAVEGAHQPYSDEATGMRRINVTDFGGVVYSSGKVFDGLLTGRSNTENFLRSGSPKGIASRSDLALLEDLRDVLQFIIDQTHRPLRQAQELFTAAFVCAVTAKITRSGAIPPGQLRTSDQQIGVQTRHRRHTPEAMTDTGLQHLMQQSL